MNVMDLLKKSRSSLEVVVACLVAWVYLENFVDERIVSKEELLVAVNEIRIGQVQSDLRYFQRLGLDNLTEQERHQYENLVESEKKLLCTRNTMLGIVNGSNC